MERQHKVYYTIKMEKGDLLTVLVLAEPLARVASKFEGYENTRELHQDMRDRFGDVEILSPTEFEEELTKRQLHTPEVLALLISNEVMGELLGLDLTCSIVYGSPNRPMDSIWARIPKAVYMQVDKHATGYHTYIAVPEELSQEVVSRYELKFVSRPVHESELVVLEKCQAVEVIRVGWKTKGMSDKYYFYYHPECYRGSNFPNQQVERRTIQVVTNKNQCCACWQTLAAIDPPHFEGVGEKIFSFQVSVTRCMGENEQLTDLLSIPHTSAVEALGQVMEHVRAPEYVAAHGNDCRVTLLGFRTVEHDAVKAYQPRCEIEGQVGIMSGLVCYAYNTSRIRVEFPGAPAWEAKWYEADQVKFVVPVM